MSWFTSHRISETLENEKPLLDEIFGKGQYEIEDTDHAAVVRSPTLTLRFEHDRNRVGDVMAYLSAEGAASEYHHSLETWARFLGEDWPSLPVNNSGKATISAEQQIRDKLSTVARLVKQIFSDPQKAAEASFFADGYLQAYGDWCSAKGYWKDIGPR